MKTKEETDLMGFGDCTFQIMPDNEAMLSSLAKFAIYLDYKTNAGQGETLNIDGLINKLLCDAMDRKIKDYVKQYGFDDKDEFMDTMIHCADGEEVAIELANHIQAKLQKERKH